MARRHCGSPRAEGHGGNAAAILQPRSSKFLHFFRSETRSDFAQLEPFGRDVDHRQIGNDGIDAFNRSQRIIARLQDFRQTILS